LRISKETARVLRRLEAELNEMAKVEFTLSEALRSRDPSEIVGGMTAHWHAETLAARGRALTDAASLITEVFDEEHLNTDRKSARRRRSSARLRLP